MSGLRLVLGSLCVFVCSSYLIPVCFVVSILCVFCLFSLIEFGCQYHAVQLIARKDSSPK